MKRKAWLVLIGIVLATSAVGYAGPFEDESIVVNDVTKVTSQSSNSPEKVSPQRQKWGEGKAYSLLETMFPDATELSPSNRERLFGQALRNYSQWCKEQGRSTPTDFSKDVLNEMINNNIISQKEWHLLAPQKGEKWKIVNISSGIAWLKSPQDTQSSVTKMPNVPVLSPSDREYFFGLALRNYSQWLKEQGRPNPTVFSKDVLNEMISNNIISQRQWQSLAPQKGEKWKIVNIAAGIAWLKSSQDEQSSVKGSEKVSGAPVLQRDRRTSLAEWRRISRNSR